MSETIAHNYPNTPPGAEAQQSHAITEFPPDHTQTTLVNDVLSANGELQAPAPTIPVETVQQATERLRSEIQFIPDEPNQSPGETIPELTYLGYHNPDGTYAWQRSFAPTTGNFVRVNGNDPEDKQVFDYVSDIARNDETVLRGIASTEGRWWMSSKVEPLVETHLHEALRVREGQRQLDVLNCSSQMLAEEDKVSIHNVFNAVAHYTGNKVFDRVAGVVFVDNDQLGEDIAADYYPLTGVIRVSIDNLKQRSELGRYKQYFNENQTNWFEVVLAHELGHAMDIASIQEADAHNINKNDVAWNGYGGKTSDFSAMQQLPAWEGRTYKPDPNSFHQETMWRINEAAAIECRENAPTGYAHIDPREDFAESFAIAALGGDTAKFPKREAIIADTIKYAEGEALIGPKQVALETIDTANGYPLEQVKTARLNVLISTNRQENPFF